MNRKIVICSDDYLPKIGGISTCTHELATALCKLGWQVILVTRSHPDSAEHDQKVAFKVIRLHTPTDTILSIPKYIKAIRKIKKLESPDLFMHMTWLPCATAHWLSRTSTPYAVYGHGVELLESNRTFKKNLRKKINFLKKKVFKKAQWVFAVSQFTANILTENCAADVGKVHVVYNGIDIKKFYPTETRILHEKKQLLTVCRLQANKGIDQTLLALSDLKNQYNFEYLIAGDGPELNSLKKLTRNLGLINHVKFLGAVSEVKLKKIYNDIDVFIMLSRFDQKTPAVEGFGITFLEAGACKKPVIAGDSGGISDAVVDGQTGLLVSPQDTQAIKEAIAKLLGDEKLCKKLGENAFQRIHKSFTWNHIAENVSKKIERSL